MGYLFLLPNFNLIVKFVKFNDTITVHLSSFVEAVGQYKMTDDSTHIDSLALLKNLSGCMYSSFVAL